MTTTSSGLPEDALRDIYFRHKKEFADVFDLLLANRPWRQMKTGKQWGTKLGTKFGPHQPRHLQVGYKNLCGPSTQIFVPNLQNESIVRLPY